MNAEKVIKQLQAEADKWAKLSNENRNNRETLKEYSSSGTESGLLIAARIVKNNQKDDPATVTERQLRLVRTLQNFISKINEYADDPSKWPLTQDEQVAFIRRVLYHAHQIRGSADFSAEAIDRLNDLALQS